MVQFRFKKNVSFSNYLIYLIYCCIKEQRSRSRSLLEFCVEKTTRLHTKFKSTSNSNDSSMIESLAYLTAQTQTYNKMEINRHQARVKPDSMAACQNFRLLVQHASKTSLFDLKQNKIPYFFDKSLVGRCGRNYLKKIC